MNQLFSVKKIFQILVFALGINASAHADVINPISWTTDTYNNATATITGNDVALRVYQTSWASADANLGNLNGTLTINYNFSTTADGWYEYPNLYYTTNGTGGFSIPSCNPGNASSGESGCGVSATVGPYFMPNVQYGTSFGNLAIPISVNGQTDLIFAITPSGWSAAGDHANTYLNITNLSINYTPTVGGAPEIDGSLAPKVGFLLVCLFLMFGRKKQISEPMMRA